MSAKGSELKRVRQGLKRSARNKHYKSVLKSAIKKVMNAENKEEAMDFLKSSLSVIDKTSRKGIIHKNKAANQKSRLMRHVSSM
ncbi:MAG: 30S ribosomal protein S20 [Candidatus Marinimicrobia bacterium]|nr:30S ribosomal protein S20 [Candidatus Neomarinimicrobiota bacterium]|tara:strand:- start:211 stop:462 length:252 start_codon:yes stop_codon:yes gene_type:complete